MQRRLWLGLLLLPTFAFSQGELVGKNQYPQFRTMSGLPGGGFAVGPDGRVTFRGGAMAISTPIAYSLGKGKYALGISNTGSDRWRLAGLNSAGETQTNGTGWAMGGFSTPWGNLTASYMALSRIRDNAINFHFQPRMTRVDEHSAEIRRYDIGFGVQDVLNDGGANGQAIDNSTGGGNSTSFYLVGTAQVNDKLFVSSGVGTRRFRGLFGSASYDFAPQFKAVLEYDSFNWNYGIAFDPLNSKNSQVSMFLGHVRGRYLTWSVSVAF